ncbi:HepT-like ribonuclease domain-containing protein [Methanocella conradii]|uniref:HepT-like ribonuclease domain-containing protein n=1 Tax=Methanocella conradii TaxID=1175444 RepID=UPI00157D45A5|nr:DUF86 domain-containing protein [Methanocella conradii]
MSKKKRDYILFLEDILACIDKIEKYSRAMSFEEFNGNDMAVDAVIRNFEVIGEAVKKIPEEVKGKYTDVEWKEAAGFRDVLIHDYFSIDKEAVWDTIQNNIPSFKKGIMRVLASEKA